MSGIEEYTKIENDSGGLKLDSNASCVVSLVGCGCFDSFIKLLHLDICLFVCSLLRQNDKHGPEAGEAF